VVELREHRLDEEDLAAEVAKALEALGKDRVMLAKKAKLIDTALAAINQVGVQARLTFKLHVTWLPTRHQEHPLAGLNRRQLQRGKSVHWQLHS
jgi:hypothetical protein